MSYSAPTRMPGIHVRFFEFIFTATLALSQLCFTACSAQRKLSDIQSGDRPLQLNLADESCYLPVVKDMPRVRDTIIVTDDSGREMIIMKAVKDEISGEMVATDILDAAVVTARFRNVSEHKGKVDLAFQVVVPSGMRDSRWQLRLCPEMYILGDSIRLEPIAITGDSYRKSQLRGYQQYERFLSRIVEDTTSFVNMGQLEIFLQRNIPQIYVFKTDTTIVSDEQFATCYGVSEQQAVEHYTNKVARSINDSRKSRVDKMYHRFVKSPIITGGIRLDTVMVDGSGDFIYNYVQTINTRPRLRKVEIVLSGDIWEQDKRLYSIPPCSPLTFYVSSLSSFADTRGRYVSTIYERRPEANASYSIDFALGKSDIDIALGNNRTEIQCIKSNLADIIQDKSFDLDSITVTAYASPEGKLRSNVKLSESRGASLLKYFKSYVSSFKDSLARSSGFYVDEHGNVSGVHSRKADIPFINRCGGENWEMLDCLVVRDTMLTDSEKSCYSNLSLIDNLDTRESMMQQQPSYGYFSSVLYPRLRTVKFNFYLHRKGAVRDTVYTSVVDSVYMSGVQALRDMDYNLALNILRPYQDFNTAVTYVVLEKNHNALGILENLPRTAEVNYLLSVLYSRLGDDSRAVRCYLDACRKDHSYVFRGNLDPEISILIKKYGLNKDDDTGEDL